MVTEDNIDMETLQAQIDMSMSFAHNLVTSWIRPTHPAQPRSTGGDATQILEEELRRPPRLGVGASTPTAPPLDHETSKLKRRLAKDGAKKEDNVKSQHQDSLKSDDEEHKGRPAKRKTKVDPFGHGVSNKKKKANLEANRCPLVENASQYPIHLSKRSTYGEARSHNLSSGEERQQERSSDQHLAMMVPPSPVRTSIQATRPPSGSTVPAASSLSGLSLETHAPAPGTVTTPISDRTHSNSTSNVDKAKLLGIPLLNLDGPPELSDRPGDASGLNNSGRKRKRRRKKKTQAIVGVGNSSR